MTVILKSLSILMLAVVVSQAGADVPHPAPDAGADVLHQQTTIGLEEDEEDEEDEEPDCE